ncbi:MAG TPA: protein kinase [Candidatus Binatia bacterium]|nr:protein kinase [Candidatus Binatia bacterium]
MSAPDPKTIGRYNVERLLGAGGMGAVYLAEDPLLKRRLAVKVVHAGVAQHDVLLRFRREAEISARLNHPNVITIYDVGEDPAVGPFIAMEFVDGASLADLVRGGSLRSSEDRLRSLIAAAHALEAAHMAAIVHRDIKPGNVMVGHDGRVKLMDFGVARGEDTATLTVTGSVIGTPAYIAPEQLKGVEPSASTDRYAFSVMTFEVFTGTKPYVAPDTSTLLYNIAHEPPVFPEDIASPLKKIFERALAKDPAARFADLRSFLAAVIDSSIIDPVTRTRLLEALAPEEARHHSAVPEQTLAPGAPGAGAISEGMSGATMLRLGAGGIAALAALGLGLYLFGRGASEDLHRVPTEAPAAAESVAPAVTIPGEPAADLSTKAVASSVTSVEPSPPAVIEPGKPPVESAAFAPPAVEPTAEPPPRLAGAELGDAVRSALRDQGLRHVDVRVDGEHHLTLANLKDTSEAERARAVAAQTTSQALEIDTSIRKASGGPVMPTKRSAAVSVEDRRPEKASAPPAPAWQIRREGSEKTD